jgi:serine/threonine protein kinase
MLSLGQLLLVVYIVIRLSALINFRDMEDLVGKQLGQYRIEARIGQGAMATVFKAYQPSLERYVAIKVMPPFLAAENPVFVTRFQREAKAIARLQHPNILPVYDFGVDGDYTYIVMRYVASVKTLSQIVSLPLDTAPDFDTIIQVANALAYSHKNGVIHRDVKPSNILLDDGWALLSDFGVAKASEFGTRLTATGKSIGTPAYMSPEQARGDAVDHRTDIFALGLILYEMLTNTLPHDAETPLSILVKRTTELPPPPRTINPAIPERIEQVIIRALAPDPDSRFSTAEQFAIAVKAAIIEQPYRPPTTGSFDSNATGVLLTTPISTDVDDTKPATVAEKSQFGLSHLIWGIGAGISAILVVLFLWNSNVFNSTASQPTPEPSAPAIAIVPTSTETPTVPLSPTVTNTSIPPTLTPSPTSTPTPIPPTPTPAATATPAGVVVTATASPAPSSTPEPPAATPTLFPTATSSLPVGTFTLLKPLSLDEPSYGLTNFEWLWNDVVPSDYGFEIRVWREDESLAGAHDAVLDNQEGRIEQLGENRYRLTLDITQSGGVRERSGEYLWTVALVQISPSYADLGLQAEAGRLRFEAPGSGPDGGDSPGGID